MSLPVFFMRRYYLYIFVACLPLLPGCGASHDSPAEQALAFNTSDSVKIAATYHSPLRSAPPGLLLVHGLGENRRLWEPFQERASAAGYATLAFDMRGHGESLLKLPSETLDYRRFSEKDWRGVLEDIAAARAALIAQGADPERTAIVAADIGANLALRYLARENNLEAAVLLSPGLDYEGITTEPVLSQLRIRPVLLLAADGDAYAAASCRALKAAAPGFCELRAFPESAHGSGLFAASPNAMEQTLQWLNTVLPTKQNDAAQ